MLKLKIIENACKRSIQATNSMLLKRKHYEILYYSFRKILPMKINPQILHNSDISSKNYLQFSCPAGDILRNGIVDSVYGRLCLQGSLMMLHIDSSETGLLSFHCDVLKKFEADHNELFCSGQYA